MGTSATSCKDGFLINITNGVSPSDALCSVGSSSSSRTDGFSINITNVVFCQNFALSPLETGSSSELGTDGFSINITNGVSCAVHSSSNQNHGAILHDSRNNCSQQDFAKMYKKTPENNLFIVKQK